MTTEIVNTFDLRKLEQFLLILTRITAFVHISPIFGISSIPARVKIGLSVVVSFLLYGVLEYQLPEYTSLIDFATLILIETVAGLLLGFGVYLCFSIISLFGKILDVEVGLSMAAIFDPSTKTQASIMGSFYQYVIMILMVMSDMHLYMLRTLAESYEVIGIGEASANGLLYESMIEFLARNILVGFKLVLPVFVAMLLVNIVMGVLAKAAPQMSMFAVGIQIKILVGFFVIYITSRLIPDMTDIIFEEIQYAFTQILRGLR